MERNQVLEDRVKSLEEALAAEKAENEVMREKLMVRRCFFPSQGNMVRAKNWENGQLKRRLKVVEDRFEQASASHKARGIEVTDMDNEIKRLNRVLDEKTKIINGL